MRTGTIEGILRTRYILLTLSFPERKRSGWCPRCQFRRVKWIILIESCCFAIFCLTFNYKNALIMFNYPIGISVTSENDRNFKGKPFFYKLLPSNGITFNVYFKSNNISSKSHQLIIIVAAVSIIATTKIFIVRMEMINFSSILH